MVALWSFLKGLPEIALFAYKKVILGLNVTLTHYCKGHIPKINFDMAEEDISAHLQHMLTLSSTTDLLQASQKAFSNAIEHRSLQSCKHIHSSWR